MKKLLLIIVLSLISSTFYSQQPRRKPISDAFLEAREQYAETATKMSPSERIAFNLSKINLTKEDLAKGAEFLKVLYEKRKKDSIAAIEKKKKDELQKEQDKRKQAEYKKKIAETEAVKNFVIRVLSIVIIVSVVFFIKKNIAKIKTKKEEWLFLIKNTLKQIIAKINTGYLKIKDSKYFKNLNTNEMAVISVIVGVLCSYTFKIIFDSFSIVPPSFLICGGVCFLYLSKKDKTQD